MQETSNQSRAGLIIFAIIGWLAFIGVVLYGILFFGPQQFQKGFVSNVSILEMLSESPLEVTKSLDPLGNPATIFVYGSIQEIHENYLVVLVPDAATGKVKDQIFHLNENTTVVKTSTKSTETFDNNGNSIISGEVTEQAISIEDLSISQEVLIHYDLNESGEFITSKIEVTE